MTPTELKVRALKKLDEAITRFMDGLIDRRELIIEWNSAIEEFIDEFEDL